MFIFCYHHRQRSIYDNADSISTDLLILHIYVSTSLTRAALPHVNRWKIFMSVFFLIFRFFSQSSPLSRISVYVFVSVITDRRRSLWERRPSVKNRSRSRPDRMHSVDYRSMPHLDLGLRDIGTLRCDARLSLRADARDPNRLLGHKLRRLFIKPWNCTINARVYVFFLREHARPWTTSPCNTSLPIRIYCYGDTVRDTTIMYRGLAVRFSR